MSIRFRAVPISQDWHGFRIDKVISVYVRGSLYKDIATRHQTERVIASRQESTEVDIGAQR